MGWKDAPEIGAPTVVAEMAPRPAWQRAPEVPAAPDMSGVGNYLRGNLAAKAPAPQKASGFLEALEAGLQVSVSGLLARNKAPSLELDPEAPWYNRAAGNVAMMAGDVPFMAAGSVLGAGMGAPSGPGALVTGTAGAFALPAGLRATLMDGYSKGDFQSFGDFWERSSGIMWETAKGWLTGAATGGAGAGAKMLLPAAAPTAVKVLAPTAAELGTMVTVGQALEGHAPSAQDFLDAAIVLGGAKGAMKVTPKLRDIYAKTGKKPAEVAMEAKTDPTIAQDLVEPLSLYHGTKADVAVEQLSKTDDLGPHFTTSRATAELFANSEGTPGKVLEAEGRFVKPMDLPDLNSWFPTNVAEAIDKVRGAPVSADGQTPLQAKVWAAMQQAKDAYLDALPQSLQEQRGNLGKPSQEMKQAVDAAIEKGRQAGYDVLRAELRGQGYDSIRYKNANEGAPVDTYISLDPTKVRGKAQAPDIPRAYAPIAAEENARAIVPGDKAQAVAASPFADIPQAPSEPAKPTHVNYNLLNTSEDAAGALSRLSTIYEAEIQTQRRGTVGWEQTSAEAAKMLSDTLGGVDARLLMPREPGTPAGAAEILARKQLTIGAAEDMARTAKAYQETPEAMRTPEQTATFLASIERAAMIQQEFLGARAEAGRALNILKSTARDAERAKQIQDVIQMYGGDPVSLAKMIGEMADPAAALKFAKEAVKATTWEKFIEAWKSGILSGPVTHVANVLGNGVFFAMRAPIDLVASGIGALRHGPEKVAAAESFARVAGGLQGAMDGMRIGAAMLKDWRGTLDVGKAEQYRKAIDGTKGDVIRLPYRMLSAEDAVFNTMNQRGEAYTLAVRQATNEGLNPLTREFRERVASIVQNPDAKMVEAMEKAAERFTFNTPLGEMGQAVQSFVKVWHLEWAVPFIRTPANIAKELARMTPLAPALSEWRDAFKAGGIERDRALAELSVGTAAMSGVFMWALAGNVTGAGEPDAGKRRVQQAAGWQPYSVKIGDTYYAYNRLQPLGTLMGLAADMAEVWDHLTEDEADKIPKMLAVAFANAVTNQTFLQGITNVIQAMSDPTRFGPSFMQSFARSLVPNIVGQVTEMNDPVARQVNSMLEAVQSRLPGLRQDLLPKRDIFGEPVASKERLGGLSPITVTTETDDKVRSEAARLAISVGDTPKKTHVGRGSGKLGDVELEPEQRDIFADVSGHLAHDVLSKMVNGPGWDQLPDLVKKRAYSKVFLQAHRAGAAAALPPDLRAGIAQEISMKIQAELAPAGESP